MPFNLKITFTGILGFVPDKAFDKNPTVVYVLAPDGDFDPHNPRMGADERPLSRHRAFLKVKVINILGATGVPSTLEALWYLGNREFRIQATGGAPGLVIGDLSGLAKLEDVAPLFCNVDPTAVKGSVPNEKLGARFMLTAGTLSCGAKQGAWVFPDILCKDPVRIKDLSNEVILELDGLQSVAILGKPLTGGDEVPLQLSAPDGGAVEMTVGNLCDNNPLQWPGLYDRQPDEDFRWYFELLSLDDYANLATMIEGIPLPFPYPSGHPSAQGANCFPASYSPLS